MVYTLVNAPALAFDLVRMPHGHLVAEVLDVAIASGPEELRALASQHDGDRRDARWGEVELLEHPEGSAQTLHLVGEALATVAAGGQPATAVLGRLETASLGTLAALDRFVRVDALSGTWLTGPHLSVQDPEAVAAGDVLVDAAASAYCGEQLDDAARTALAAPYLAGRPTPAPAPQVAGLQRVLERVASADEAARRAWRQAADSLRPFSAAWAPAMHRATWAVSLADRLPAAARAQLAAVQAFRQGGFTAQDAAHGVWNCLSGTVQSLISTDLVADDDRAFLTRAWTGVHGPLTA